METFSEVTWAETVRFCHGDISDSLAENAHSEEEQRNVFIGGVQDTKFGSSDAKLCTQNHKMGNMEENDKKHENNSDHLKSKLQSSILKEDIGCCVSEDIVSFGEIKSDNIKTNSIAEEMDESVDTEIIESDDENDNCSLVMELPCDQKRADLSQTALAQISSPKMTKSTSPIACSLSPLCGEISQNSESSIKNILNQQQDLEISHNLASVSQSLLESAHKKTSSQSASVANAARSLPIHCIVEQFLSDVVDCHSDGCHSGQIVLDTYAILPGTTLFSELVTNSLLKLGYSPSVAVDAKGGIQLKNWKTLMFEAITDKGDATIEEILGEVTSVATLKISLSSQIRRNSSNSEDIKDRLLQLLLTKSIDFLVQTGCPVEKSLLEAISTGEVAQNISEKVCNSFNEWYLRQKTTSSPQPENSSTNSTSIKPDLKSSMACHTQPRELSPLPEPKVAPFQVTQAQVSELKATPSAALKCPAPLSRSSPLNLDIKEEHTISKSEYTTTESADSLETLHRNHFFLAHKNSDLLHKTKKIVDKTPEKTSLDPNLYAFQKSTNEGSIPSTLQNHHPNPYMGLIPGKTRIRTSFDPEQEIPRLQKWFGANQHPTREQMMRFMHELNGLESRKGRRPLDLTNIIYWFKNARAAQRRATRALDDSFENEENMDMNSVESVNSDSVPPFLPNKNAVYMIPFHPYPNLPSTPGIGSSHRKTSMTNPDLDEPYDLSLTKRPSLEGKEKEANNFPSLSSTPSPTKSSSTSSECEGSSLKKKKTHCPPRFPALLDVASKMRQEIPLRSDDAYFNSSSHNINNHNGCRRSPFRSKSSANDMENVNKNEDIESSFSNPSTPMENGDSGVDKFSSSLKIKHEEEDFLSHENSRNDYQISNQIIRESVQEVVQIKTENENKMNLSEDDEDDDDDNTNDSYNSEEELKLRIKQNAAAVVDYPFAMHNNVSRLTAANMAALSLAQMGQSLHIPQLTSSLAMAYYPMDPRFYTQSSVPHSLATPPPSSLPTSHTSHINQLSLRQNQDCAVHIDSRSPLPSPSIIQQSLNQLNHHHHHHHQQHSPQQHHHRHNSEPRKRRTRVFIDPLTEIPKLEKWFLEDTHPSAFMIDKFCEELNKCEYRHKFPKLEPKNVQLWFKNHRAKVKRMKVSCDEQGILNGSCGHDDDILD